MATGKKWTREELIVALNLYRKLSFGQLHSRNPVIIALAEKLGRGANSVAMKLNNLASLDPLLRARGVRGLEGASNLDREIWNVFYSQPEELVPQSEEALRTLFGATNDEEVDVVKNTGIRVRRVLQPPEGPTEQIDSRKVRRSQQFFRQMILNAFDRRCCVTGVPVSELLVASHIVPWSKFPKERLNPQNGLCLSRLHDGAFDSGLITFDDDCRLVLSSELKSYLPQNCLKHNFAAFDGKALRQPQEAPEPSKEFLRFHREKIFRD